MDGFNIQPDGAIPGAQPLVEGLGEFVQHDQCGPPAYLANEGTLGAKPVQFWGGAPSQPPAGSPPPGAFDYLVQPQLRQPQSVQQPSTPPEWLHAQPSPSPSPQRQNSAHCHRLPATPICRTRPRRLVLPLP